MTTTEDLLSHPNPWPGLTPGTAINDPMATEVLHIEPVFAVLAAIALLILLGDLVLRRSGRRTRRWPTALVPLLGVGAAATLVAFAV